MNINATTSTTTNTSSIYGSRNILSGLASGLDTESMIENSVQGYKKKIEQLQQEQTKVQWQQDSYRDIIDQLNDFSNKYMSFTSKTNLLSNAMYNTTSVSSSSNKIDVSGKTSSDIEITKIEQLAAAASITTSLSAETSIGEVIGGGSYPQKLVINNTVIGEYSATSTMI